MIKLISTLVFIDGEFYPKEHAKISVYDHGLLYGTSLRRIRNLRRINNRDYLIGLGGEIAGDWESVQWLTRHAAPLGLNYVSTPPERILFSLFASAQASLVEF
ncbi:hypothetical protein NST12_03075 [Bacillus sp. FSL W8-1127]|uniref:hypothetical protein n=1 Tax=Bacillus sp. FSL W8-1127 TaxID=2954710 RepID=UPI0030F61226